MYGKFLLTRMWNSLSRSELAKVFDSEPFVLYLVDADYPVSVHKCLTHGHTHIACVLYPLHVNLSVFFVEALFQCTLRSCLSNYIAVYGMTPI